MEQAQVVDDSVVQLKIVRQGAALLGTEFAGGLAARAVELEHATIHQQARGVVRDLDAPAARSVRPAAHTR